MERIAFRGAALVLIAIIVGVVVLAVALDDPPSVSEEVAEETTTTTTLAEAPVDEAPAISEPENPGPIDPSTVRVIVANGSGISGAAGKITNRLNALNYSTLSATNTNQPQPKSNIYFLPGSGLKALQIAAELGITDDVELGALVQPLPIGFDVLDVEDATVVIVLGGPDSFVTSTAS